MSACPSRSAGAGCSTGSLATGYRSPTSPTSCDRRTSRPATRITVSGHPALEFPGEITWTAHGQRLTVSAQDLPAAELVAVADSMPA